MRLLLGCLQLPLLRFMRGQRVTCEWRRRLLASLTLPLVVRPASPSLAIRLARSAGGGKHSSRRCRCATRSFRLSCCVHRVAWATLPNGSGWLQEQTGLPAEAAGSQQPVRSQQAIRSPLRQYLHPGPTGAGAAAELAGAGGASQPSAPAVPVSPAAAGMLLMHFPSPWTLANLGQAVILPEPAAISQVESTAVTGSWELQPSAADQSSGCQPARRTSASAVALAELSESSVAQAPLAGERLSGASSTPGQQPSRQAMPLTAERVECSLPTIIWL